MTAWILLVIAVGANIASNTMFKFAMRDFPSDITLNTMFRFAFNPFLWAGGVACIVLLSCYLLSLRDISMVVAYVFVISLSMVGIGVMSAVLFGEPISFQAGIGMVLIISGVALVASDNQTPDTAGIASAQIEEGAL